MSLPAAPVASPFGDVWLQAQGLDVVQVGVLPMPTWSVTIPATLAPGFAASFQAGLLWQGTGSLSPPLTTLVL